MDCVKKNEKPEGYSKQVVECDKQRGKEEEEDEVGWVGLSVKTVAVPVFKAESSMS
jgi:hypothetical protein